MQRGPTHMPHTNIILMLIDDMGWTDLSCFGSDLYETPNIDRLASEGMKFTNAYSACTVCSPTRGSIMSGKYPAHTNVTDWIPGHRRPFSKFMPPDWTQYLSHDEVCVARPFRKAGYATASIGKWHLGDEPYWPQTHGFDLNIAGSRLALPPSYWVPYGLYNLEDGPEGEYLTERLTSEVEAYLEEHAAKPFFLYFPHYAVHTPVQAPKHLVEKYEKLVSPEHVHRCATYAAMVETVDDSVGRVSAKLDELGIADNTVLIFVSDNGGLTHVEFGGETVTSNSPLREGKGSAYEGGVRVPMIVRWPGVAEPGSVCDTPVISCDFYPTVLEMAGVEPDPDHVVDGRSLVPLLKQSGDFDRDAIYWHYPHYHPGTASPYSAIRRRDWKLIEFYEDGRVELYNLTDDIGETKNLARKKPELAAELREKLEAWRQSVNAQPPLPNPDYDAERDREVGFRRRKKGWLTK